MISTDLEIRSAVVSPGLERTAWRLQLTILCVKLKAAQEGDVTFHYTEQFSCGSAPLHRNTDSSHLAQATKGHPWGELTSIGRQ